MDVTHTNTAADFRNDKVTLFWFKETSNTNTCSHSLTKGNACMQTVGTNLDKQQLKVHLHQRLSINLTVTYLAVIFVELQS